MNDVTQILNAIERGDRQAAGQLLPLIYDELRKLAAQKLAHESSGQTLPATALVHEAYVRLVGDGDAKRWDNRRHFFAAAAEAMRRILVDRARHKAAEKHGGELQRRSHRRVVGVEHSTGLRMSGRNLKHALHPTGTLSIAPDLKQDLAKLKPSLDIVRVGPGFVGKE